MLMFILPLLELPDRDTSQHGNRRERVNKLVEEQHMDT